MLTQHRAMAMSVAMSNSESKFGRSLAIAIVLGLVAIGFLLVVLFPPEESRYIVWDRGEVSVPRLLDQAEVRLDDLPSVVDAVARGTGEDRFAALAFGTPDRPLDEDALNLNITVEDGRIGFDWVLLAPRNIEDRGLFVRFARRHGVEPEARTMNGVSYVRVEPEDVASFTASVATDMYGLPETEPLTLYYQGIEWEKSGSE
jgi:hypothetical protein